MSFTWAFGTVLADASASRCRRATLARGLTWLAGFSEMVPNSHIAKLIGTCLGMPQGIKH